jgi:hypothetical protein
MKYSVRTSTWGFTGIGLLVSACGSSPATSPPDASKGAMMDATKDGHTNPPKEGGMLDAGRRETGPHDATSSDAGTPKDGSRDALRDAPRSIPDGAVVVSLSDGGPHALAAHWLGINTENEYSTPPAPAWNDPHVGPALAELGIRAVRYPGGQIANFWDWKAGQGGWVQNQTVDAGFPDQGRDAAIDESFAAVASSIAEAGAAPIFMLNVLTWEGRVATSADNDAMVSDQLAMLQAAADAGLPIDYLELGNELYFGPPDLPDYQLRFDGGAAYAAQMNGWIASLRSQYPDAAIALSGGTVGQDKTEREKGWISGLAPVIGDVNALVVHDYVAVSDAGTPSATVLDEAFSTWQRDGGGLNLVTSIGALGPETWVTEFDLNDTSGGHFAGTWVHGLFVGERLLEYLSVPSIARVCLYNFSTGTSHAAVYDVSGQPIGTTDAGQVIHSTAWQESASGAAYALFGRALAGAVRVQGLTFASPATTPGMNPALTGVAIENGQGQWQVVVLNATSQTFSLDLGGIVSATEAETISEPALATPVGMTLVPTSAPIQGGVLSVPAYGIVRTK